ncbi:MAG: TonB family protein [Pseudomonadota bacterium]
MNRLIPFLCFSLALHGGAFATLANFMEIPSGVIGSETGDPERVSVSVVAEEEVTATAPLPCPVDSIAAVESKEAAEPVAPDPTPEVIAKQEPEVPADFTTEPVVEEEPEPEPPKETPEKEIVEKEHEESTASKSQVASDVQKSRAALGRDLRDFHSRMIAAIRQAIFFPEEAARKRQYGEVVVRFRINVKGELTRLEVIGTSGAKALDNAALEIIRKAVNKFPTVPPGLDENELHYTLPILFKKKEGSRA